MIEWIEVVFVRILHVVEYDWVLLTRKIVRIVIKGSDEDEYERLH